jgi:hypothetical protein
MDNVMWRNVIISSLWQSVILALVIFLGPGLLVADYWTMCAEKQDPALPLSATNTCLKYNPYFTDYSYVTKGYQKYWTNKKITQASQFDEDALDDMSCEYI